MAVFKPVVPMVADAWSHTFNKAEHLATVHAHYGNHHLDNEVADKARDKESAGNEKTTKTDNSFSPHVFTLMDGCSTAIVINLPAHFCTRNSNTLTGYLYIQRPPPKF